MTEIVLFMKEIVTWMKDHPRITTVLILLLGSNFVVAKYTYITTSAQFEATIAQMNQRNSEAEADALKKNESLKKQLQGELDDANQRNADLNRELSGFRLRLHSCSQGGKPGAASAGVPSAPGTGSLPEDPQGKLDQVTASLINEAKLADDTVESCRVVKEWAKAQAPQSH